MPPKYKPSPPRPNGSHYCQNTRNILPLMKPLGQFGPFACPGSKITKNPICAHFRAATAVKEKIRHPKNVENNISENMRIMRINQLGVCRQVMVRAVNENERLVIHASESLILAQHHLP